MPARNENMTEGDALHILGQRTEYTTAILYPLKRHDVSASGMSEFQLLQVILSNQLALMNVLLTRK